MELQDIQSDLKHRLSKKRFEHTLGVMYTASALAMCYDIDLEKARYAGLLHDCAKYLDDDKKIAVCQKYNIPISPVEEKNKELLHAKIGAVFAQKRYAVSDSEVLDAITYHTTGRPGMTLLEQIVFVADYIEPNRKPLPGLEQIRYLAFHDLTKCIVQIIENTLQYLKEKKSTVDAASLSTYEYYKSQLSIQTTGGSTHE